MTFKRIRRYSQMSIGIRTLAFSLASVAVMTVFSAALVNGDTLLDNKDSAAKETSIDTSTVMKNFSLTTPAIVIEASSHKTEEAAEPEAEVIIEVAEVVEVSAEPEPAWTEEACSIVMYLTSNCNVRTEPSVGAELIEILAAGTQVNVIAKTNKDFVKIENGSFISSKYLSETAPAPAPAKATAPTSAAVTGTTGYAQLDELILGIFNKIFTSGMSDSEKIRACYVYMIQNTSYQKGMPMPSGFGNTSVEGSNSYVASAAYGCLTTGKGTCNRYSAAFVAMMRVLGYEAHYVSGLTSYSNGTMGGHAWTEVVIGGTAYIFDPQVEDNMISSGVSDGYTRYWKTYTELGSKYIKQ